MGNAADIRRRSLRICGVVQGVGFRPFVYRTARELGLVGWVRNSPDGVEVEVEGEAPGLDEFMRRIRVCHPPGAVLRAIDAQQVPSGPERTFEIRAQC